MSPKKSRPDYLKRRLVIDNDELYREASTVESSDLVYD
jgi:hypothetical protein